MIDLRSDTLTMPDEAMLQTILTAPLGDDGRTNEDGRGEDETINKLEDFASSLVGKESGVLLPTGTMGNTVAMFAHCKRGDKVLVERKNHVYVSEKIAFDADFGGITPVFYDLDDSLMPDLNSMEKLLQSEDIKLIWLENSHNFSAGAYIDVDRMKAIQELSKRYNVPIHMDGARLFHVAAALKVDVKEITQYVDTVMFCLSKGLGAPVGSLLCGSESFILEARKIRKLFGGTTRQGGIIAAPGLYALQHNVDRLVEDVENAKLVAQRINNNLNKIKLVGKPQTNIVILDTLDAGIKADEFCKRARSKGLLVRPVLNDHLVRLVFYKGISEDDALKTAEIILDIDSEL